MAKLESKLKKLIATLEGKLRELAALPGYTHVKPLGHPPASERELLDYERHLGVKLPPSYRALLSLHDGYEWLAYPGHLLSLRDLMPGGAWHDKVKAWKRTSAKYGAEEVVDAIPIANLGQPNSWVYLDPHQAGARGELMVVEWDPEDAEEYDSVVEYLEECVATVQYGIDEATGTVPDGAGDDA